MFYKVSTAICAAVLAAGSVSVVSAHTGRALLTDDGSAAVGNPIQMLSKEIRDLDLPFTLKKEDVGAEEADVDGADLDEASTQTRSLLDADLTRAERRAARIAALNESRARRAAQRRAACEARVANIERRNRTRARTGKAPLTVPNCEGVDRTRSARDFRAGLCVRRFRDCSDGRPCCRSTDVCVTETVGDEPKSLCELDTSVGAYGK